MLPGEEFVMLASEEHTDNTNKHKLKTVQIQYTYCKTTMR